MPTYKQVVNHVKKHVLWKDEYFERYYRLNPELVQKRLDKIYQAEDDLMVLISTQLFCFLQANGTLYFLQIFQRQRGAKITVVLPDYTECLIYQ